MNITEQKLQEIAYELYKIDWERTHISTERMLEEYRLYCLTMIEDEDGVVLTKSNVEFPTHFYHTSVETGAVDCLKNGEIKEYINKGIDFFRANKDEFCWWTATGNLTLFVIKMDGEEEYWVFATGDYYETHIPFHSEDY